MSIVGRRGSSGSGWSWSRPPSGPPRRPPSPPLLPLAGGGIVALLVALALLAVLLSDGDGNTPAGVTGTPTPTPAVAASPSPTATVTPTATPTPAPALSPTPTPTATPVPGGNGSLFGLATWDGRGWQFGPSPGGATYREGEVIPLLLRIDGARSGDVYPLTIRYDCEAFAFLTAYGRDHGSEPTLASGGPGSAIPDASLSIPDDPGTPADDGEGGSLSLWGGTFTRLDGPLPSSACTGEKSLTVGLTAAADTVFLMWAAELSRGAAERDAPLRLAVQAPGVDDLIIEIGPESVRPTQP